jgi:hypothetical protein
MARARRSRLRYPTLMFKRFSLVLVVLLFGAVVLSACGASNTAAHTNVAMAPASSLPQAMQKAPTTVRESYQFAVANPDALKNVPCYCGCGSIGHTSNLSCYVKEMDGNGKVVAFDNHALGCSLCVDIAQDVMKMTREGKSPTATHQAILDTYSQYGPANQ